MTLALTALRTRWMACTRHDEVASGAVLAMKQAHLKTLPPSPVTTPSSPRAAIIAGDQYMTVTGRSGRKRRRRPAGLRLAFGGHLPRRSREESADSARGRDPADSGLDCDRGRLLDPDRHLHGRLREGLQGSGLT